MVFPGNYKDILRELLYTGKSFNAIMSHECLHKVQADASPEISLLRTLNSYCSRTNQDLTFSGIRFNEDIVVKLRAIMGNPLASADDTANYSRFVISRIEKLLPFYEISAHVSFPEVDGESINLPYDMGMHGDNFFVSHVMGYVTALFGYFSNGKAFNDASVDIEVNRFIGLNGMETPAEIKRLCGTEEGLRSYFRKGFIFLKERSERMEKVKDAAYELVNSYFAAE